MGDGSAAVSSRAGIPVIDTTFTVILSLSFCHLLNDMMQSLVPALYPILKTSYALSFSQVGLITLAFQCTASMLQPVVGLYTDRQPRPYSLTIGIGLTLNGEEMQSGATDDLIFSVPALVAQLSKLMTLEPGDVVSTGTPEGVGMGRDPRVWLADGDEVVVSSPQLGRLTTRISA